MRARVPVQTVAVVLFLGVALSGCLGGEDDLDGEAIEITAVPPLETRIQSAASSGIWYEPGDTLDVEAVVPDNAVGNLSYTWAIQPDAFTVAGDSKAIDTGELEPGESGDLSFDKPGFYEFGHCDPHPWMEHTVAVIDGYDGPDHVTVYMIEEDVADQDTYKFVPEHITIGTGTTVTYVNEGDVMHTASVAHAGEPVPVPARLDLQEASGTVTLDGAGWMNLLVFVEDEAGNGGFAKQNVYVRERFDDYEATSEGSFMTFLEDLETEETHDHIFVWSGTVTLNVTLPGDPTGAIHQVDVELHQLDDSGDRVQTLIAENGTGEAEFSTGFSIPRPAEFELVVRPALGLLIDYEIGVHVEYDHTPPELVELPCPEPHYSLGHC